MSEIQTNFRASDMLGVTKPAAKSAAKPAAKPVAKVEEPKPVVVEPVKIEAEAEAEAEVVLEVEEVVVETTAPAAKKINKSVKG
jgi:hypothetical protein